MFSSSPPPGFPTPRSFELREFFTMSPRAHARLERLQAQQDAALLVADERVVTLDAGQLTKQLPGCSQASLQNAATALASIGFEGALRESLRHTDARELPPGHFAGVGAGLFARVQIKRGTVLGLYGGAYKESDEVEAEQQAEYKAGRGGSPRVLAHLFELDVEDLVVDAMAEDGARCWGGCINASRRDVPPGTEGSVANVVFVSGVRGTCVPGPLPGLRLPMLFCVASRDIAAGAELLLDYGDAYWQRHDEQQRRAQESKRDDDAKSKAPARVAARASCECLRLGSGITPELCPKCNPGQVTMKNGRTLRLRQPAAAGEVSPPAKRPRGRSLGPTLEATSPMEVEPMSPGAEALVLAVCDAAPSPAALLALHQEVAASVVPAILRTAAEAASAAAEVARNAAALSDNLQSTAHLFPAVLQTHGAKLEAEAQRAAADAAAAELSRAALERDAAPLLKLRVPDGLRAPGYDAAAACSRFRSAEPAALLRAYRRIALPRMEKMTWELPFAAAARAVVTAVLASIFTREAAALKAELDRSVPALLAAAEAARNASVALDVKTQSAALLAAANAAARKAQAEAKNAKDAHLAFASFRF